MWAQLKYHAYHGGMRFDGDDKYRYLHNLADRWCSPQFPSGGIHRVTWVTQIPPRHHRKGIVYC